MLQSSLQSQNYRELLDTVDNSRAQGLNRYGDIPQIIACGDQSPGNSSGIEAISGWDFPVKDNLI